MEASLTYFKSVVGWESHPVEIHNARQHQSVLENQGFRLISHPTRVDFFDDNVVRKTYYPEVEALVQAETGASRVMAFDYTRRTSDRDGRDGRFMRTAVYRVHNDYTELSGPQRVRARLSSEAEDLLTHRFAILHVWRSICGIIEMCPLAVADTRSISSKDFVTIKRASPLAHYADFYGLSYSPTHRWCWFPEMTSDEVLIFKNYDSDPAYARWTFHAAFDAPHGSDAKPRESIEVKTFAFF